MLEKKVANSTELETIERKIKDQIAQAIVFAETSPFPFLQY